MKKYVEIENVHAREVLDFNGIPTIEVEVRTEEGDIGRAIVSSNYNSNKNGAIEVRDGDKSRYNGNGVTIPVDNINSLIAQEIEGLNALNQTEIDEKLIELDGTENKSKLGANTLLAVSIAVSKASACNLQIPLYQHLGGISGRNIPILLKSLFEEDNIFIAYTLKEAFSERLRKSIEEYNKIQGLISDKLINNREDMVSYINNLINKNGLLSVAWKDDELLSINHENEVNAEKIREIVPVEIGTITEIIDKIRNAKSHGYTTIISSCIGETEDTFISDLAVGLNAKYMNFRTPVCTKNACKYNRLLRIEEMMRL